MGSHRFNGLGRFRSANRTYNTCGCFRRGHHAGRGRLLGFLALARYGLGRRNFFCLFCCSNGGNRGWFLCRGSNGCF